MRYLCDVCLEELTSHTTAVRGVEEAICDACLVPSGVGLFTAWYALRPGSQQAGLVRARKFLRKQQYWRLEAVAEEEPHQTHDEQDAEDA